MESCNVNLSSAGTCKLARIGEADIESLVELEKKLNPSPWEADNFHHSLKASHICPGIKMQGCLIAYAVCAARVGEAKLLLIGVDPAHQRKGLARYLLRYVSQYLPTGVTSLFLEVRASNAPAIAFYESEGFHGIGRHPDYYPTGRGWEDALLFAKDMENLIEPQ